MAYHVVLLTGQSNMVGRDGPIDGVLDATNARIDQLKQDGSIAIAADPLDHHDPRADEIGLGLSFAKLFLDLIPANDKVLLVPAAKGATGFWEGHWTDGGQYKTSAISQLQLAMTEPGALFRAILWHQGERDANQGWTMAQYMSAVTELIGDLRAAVAGSERVPFVCGDIVDGGAYDATDDGVRSALSQVPDHVAYTGFASSSGLSDKGDDLHFDAASLRALGSRYFSAYQSAISNSLDNMGTELDPRILAPMEVDSVDIDSGRLVHWKFDESGNNSTASDSSGNGIDGTLTTFPADPSANWVSGTVGNALDFDGTNDFVLGSNLSSDLAYPFSISVWVRADNAHDGSAFGVYDSTVINEFACVEVDEDSGSLRARMITNNGGGAESIFGSSSLTVDQWHHLVGVFTASERRLYVDGVLDGSSTISYSLPAGVVTPNAGRRGDSTDSNYLDGKVDDARLYDVELSQEQITALYGLGGGFGGEALRSGSFDDDSEWSTEEDFSVTGGKAVKSAGVALSSVSQSGVSIVEDTEYRLELEIESITSAPILVYVAGTLVATITVGTTGLFALIIKTLSALVTPGLFLISQIGLGASSILSVSLKQVL